ncbi:amidohydrolase [soil metagenome]
MITLLDHAIILTVDATRQILLDGAIAFDDTGAIVALGTSDEVHRQVADAKVVDCRDRLITPGYVDAHVHLGEHVAKGLVPDDAAPDEWLPDWLLPMYAALEPDDERVAAEVAIAEMLLTGTTTFCEAGTLLEWRPVADAVVNSGIRGQLGRWTWDLPALPARMAHPDTPSALDSAAELVDGVAGLDHMRLSAAVIVLGLGTASDELLRGAKELAGDRNVPAAMMWASVAREHGGSRVSAAHLEKLGWLDPDTKLTHAVYLEDDDEERLVAAGISIAHCPSAALRHVKGLPRHGRIPELLDAGVAVGLGGDSANGSNHVDMHKLMYLAATIFKDHRMDQTVMPPETALEMGTRHGAECLGMLDQIGSLEVGKRADLVVYDLAEPEWRPLLHPLQNLVLGASDRSIAQVWVDGRKVVENGQVLTFDVGATLDEVDRRSADLLSRIGLSAPWAWPFR